MANLRMTRGVVIGKAAFTLVLFALAVAVLPLAAAAKELHANVVSWTPADATPDERVAVIFNLYVAGESPHPEDGRPVPGVSGVEVIIRGDGQTRRFPAEDLGGGPYGAEIIFPEGGDWDLRVAHGQGSEILLGKGAIHIDDASASGGFPARPIWLVFGGVLVLALAGLALVWHSRLRPSPPPDARTV